MLPRFAATVWSVTRVTLSLMSIRPRTRASVNGMNMMSDTSFVTSAEVKNGRSTSRRASTLTFPLFPTRADPRAWKRPDFSRPEEIPMREKSIISIPKSTKERYVSGWGLRNTERTVRNRETEKTTSLFTKEIIRFMPRYYFKTGSLLTHYSSVFMNSAVFDQYFIPQWLKSHFSS